MQPFAEVAEKDQFLPWQLDAQGRSLLHGERSPRNMCYVTTASRAGELTWCVLHLNLGNDLDGRQRDLQVGDAGELGEVMLPQKERSSFPA